MMNRSKMRQWFSFTITLLFLFGASVYFSSTAFSDSVEMDDFDHQGKKIYSAYESTPQRFISAGSGGRTLNQYYSQRQFPGSPPVIPHGVDLSFSGNETDCLSCHASGGYSQEYDKFVPVTPHPENTLCYQCHAQAAARDLFVGSDWKSISPPRLGRSSLSNSPPLIPHSLQLRENCIACHTGPGAVAEIRVEHSARGNCRQCHVEAVQTAPMKVFSRITD